MINTKKPNTNDYTQVGFIEAKDNQNNYQNIDHIYDSEGNIVFQQGYLNEYDGADDFGISAIGKPLIDYTIYGNTEQIGIPEPNEPIYPEGCGEQTNNLVPPLSEWVDGFIWLDGTLQEQTENFEKTSGMIPVKPNIKYTFAHESGSFPDGENGPRSVIAQYDNTGKYINQEAWTYKNPYPYTPSDNVGYVRLYFNTYNQPGNIMFNIGPDALPYEPYGYKIPIMAGKYEFLEEPLRAVKNYKDTIDLSTKLLNRQIKELVLTGEEAVYKYEYSGTIGFTVNNILDANYNRTRGMCTHYTVATGAYKNSLWIGVNNKNLYFIGIGDILGIAKEADFKTYLAQQYAAGTPITIWYALAEPITTTLSSIPDGLRGIIEGKGSQLSTPSPSNPIEPIFYGDKTRNLFDKSKRIDNSRVLYTTGEIGALSGLFVSDFTPIKPNTTYTLNIVSSISNKTGHLFALYDENRNFVNTGTHSVISGATVYTITTPSDVAYIRFNGNMASVDEAMLNEGSTAFPYEPYGYKLNILSGGATTPVYLSEVESTRRIKKLVLTGGEESTYFYRKNTTSPNDSLYYISFSELQSAPVNGFPLYCTHLQNLNHTPSNEVGITVGTSYNVIYFNLGLDAMNAQTSGNTVAGLREYLAAQYAAGTPVTIWYVLATEETVVVNEPLMRIGSYADTLSMEQAGVDIPTLKRPNTTEIDIVTSLPPSEVYAKYRGSKTQKYDLFLAANGDSFEAKNGQSLYIGDDT